MKRVKVAQAVLAGVLMVSAGCATPSAAPTPAPPTATLAPPTIAATAAPPTAGPTATRLPLMTAVAGAGRLVATGPTGLTGDLVVAYGDGPLWFVSPANGWYTLELVPKPTDGVIVTPAWAPDGNRVAFSVRAQNATQAGTLPPTNLYTIGIDGTGMQELVAPSVLGEVNQDAAWWPDGSGLLFTSSAILLDSAGIPSGVKIGIDRVDAHGQGRSTFLLAATAPAIAPDGKHLAFLRPSVDGLRQGLYLADADGRNERQLVPDTRFLGIVSPRFTPDGQALTFVASEKYWPTPTPAPSEVEWWLNLFLDGTAEAHFGPFEVWRVALDGTGLTQVTAIGYDQPALAWAPDGQALALVSPEGFYVTSADGQSLARVTQEGGHGGVDWRPAAVNAGQP